MVQKENRKGRGERGEGRGERGEGNETQQLKCWLSKNYIKGPS